MRHEGKFRPIVGDLFSGGGGFAEGFEQAGFHIAWGVDLWEPAVRTFGRNHPRALAIKADILSLDPASLPKIDVLIGSPPCVHFSPANKGGGGDREKGMILVRRFLDFVAALRPRYWVMENVPAMLPDLLAEMNNGLFKTQYGSVSIPIREVFDSAAFSTPQSRKRLYSGQFPPPESTLDKSQFFPLRSVTDSLPCPALGFPRGDLISDPIYSDLTVASEQLRDHFEDTRWQLSEPELESARISKEQHAVYGRMSFPDSVDRPCRTITATRTRGSRSTIIIPCEHDTRAGLRTLTLRECASVQGFPLSYQFWAKTMGDKDYLVGNAVAPPVARAVAISILEDEGIAHPKSPIVSSIGALPEIVQVKRSGSRHFSLRRRFRGIVPIDWRHDHRVELDNEAPTVSEALPPDVLPPIIWRTRLYLGYATKYKRYDLRLAPSLALARKIVSDPESGIANVDLARALLPAIHQALNGFPDGMNLQERWSGWSDKTIGPAQLVSLAASLVDSTFPVSRWAGVTIPVQVTSSVLEAALSDRGSAAEFGQPVQISTRLVVASLILSLFCLRLNGNIRELEVIQRSLLGTRGMQSKAIDELVSSATRSTSDRKRGQMQSRLRVRPR